jgi:cytochrome P450
MIDNPYPVYARLRDEDPVHRSPFMAGSYVLSRYDDVSSALRDHERFSSNPLGAEVGGHRFLIGSDPPDHTKLRRLVTKPFTPSAIAALEPRVRHICNELVDELIAANADGKADLIGHLGYPLPVIVIAELMGIPPDRRDDFKRWSDAMLGGLSPDFDPTQAGLSALEMFQYFGEVIEARQAQPEEDLISILVNGAEPLNREELLMFCMLLLIAGNETTTNLVSNGALALFSNPDQAERLRDDQSLIPAAIEEALRYDSPVQALWRQARTDIDLHGTTIPSGSQVVVLYASANRDERHYPDADQFRIDRNPRDHVAFGAGIHLCLGAALARMEGRVVAEVLLERTKHMRQEAPGERIHNAIVRGMRSLPVTFEVA